MATAKSTRSRGLTGTPAKLNPKDSGAKLEDNLNVFKSDNFDADGYVQSKCNSLNEKHIKRDIRFRGGAFVNQKSAIYSGRWRFEGRSRVCANSFRSLFLAGSSWLGTLSCASAEAL